MIQRRSFTWLAGASLVLLPFIAKADTPTIQTQDNQKSQLEHADRKVLEDLHESNIKEIQLGNLALNKTQSAEIKQYANQLVTDHTDADQKVKDLAQKNNLTFKEPQPANEMNKSDVKKLNAKTGDDFDKAFIQGMLDDHRKDIKKVQSAQKDLKSAEVKQLVAQILPTLQAHEKHAARLSQSSSSSNANPGANSNKAS
jgi:putative membrane protein